MFRMISLVIPDWRSSFRRHPKLHRLPICIIRGMRLIWLVCHERVREKLMSVPFPTELRSLIPRRGAQILTFILFGASRPSS